MSQIFRRCGCRTGEGKPFGTLPVKSPSEAQKAGACPKMADSKHGSYAWRLSRGFDPATGKRVQVNGSYPTLKEATTALNQARVKKDQGQLVAPTSFTVATYAEVWLERRQTTGDRPMKTTTAAMYRRYLVGDIAPSALGKTKLSAVRRSDVTAFVDRLRKAGRGPTTIRRILAVVQGILSGAVREELIPINVAHRVDVPPVVKAERELWTPEQLVTFLKVASDHRLGAMFEVGLFAALRRGEVCGLRWEDVDLGRGLLAVRHNRTKAVDGTVSDQTTKTASSTATVAMSTEAVAALEGWKLRQALERDEWGEAWTDTGFVFTREDGTPLDPPYATKLFDRLRRQAGLPKMTLHGLRHVAATYMWEGGADIAMVSKALRHSSVGVTASVYAHLREGAQRAAFDSIGKRLSDPTAHTVHTTAS